MCGEKRILLLRWLRPWGSPPRVRGKGATPPLAFRKVRITPACAGKSLWPGGPQCRCRDHPRVCGEKSLNRYTPAYRSGSPPPVRGKVAGNLEQGRVVGITPACAGKSRSQPRLPCTGRDHPRVCGEKSPTIRPRCRFSCCPGDYPRVCGEKPSTTSTDIHPAGSPPRVRGKTAQSKLGVSIYGITPAHAGKSGAPTLATAATGDHPRVCGEKLRIVEVGRVKEGSPPRMRGKICADVIVHIQPGITPACAGKSCSHRSFVVLLRDHPRACGEKFHPASDRKFGRVRGTKRSSGPAPAAAPAGLAGSCPASPPWSYPPRITVSRPRP